MSVCACDIFCGDIHTHTLVFFNFLFFVFLVVAVTAEYFRNGGWNEYVQRFQSDHDPTRPTLRQPILISTTITASTASDAY